MAQTFQSADHLAKGLQGPSKITKIPLNTPGAFVLRGLLSPQECQFFIDETEKLEYGSLKDEYNPQYRDNDRCVAVSTKLAMKLYERIQPFLPEQVDIQGKWDICGTNEAFRFCRYKPGGHFSAHYDGCFVRNSSERSFYTVNIYLNGGFSGGTTNFLAKRYKTVQKRIIVDQVVPEAGLALIFPHELLHEGDRLLSGVKYLMRSDVMYRRHTSTPSGAPSTAGSEVYLKAVNMYQEAALLERAGKSMEAMELYRKAFKLCPEVAELQ